MKAQRELVEAQFTRQADAYARTPVVANDRFHRRLVDASGARRNDRVLDVACGPGLLTRAFARVARAVVGFDVTHRFLRAAAEEARAAALPAAFVRGDVTDFPFPTASFDVASCKFAFHHFPDPERVFAEIARVTRRGGRILVVDMIGSEDPARRSEHDRIERLCDPSHASALPRSTFERIFADAGVNVVSARESRTSYGFDEWLGHAGPSRADAEALRAWAESAAGTDVAGAFLVRRETDGLHVSHAGVTWLLERT